MAGWQTVAQLRKYASPVACWASSARLPRGFRPLAAVATIFPTERVFLRAQGLRPAR